MQNLKCLLIELSGSNTVKLGRKETINIVTTYENSIMKRYLEQLKRTQSETDSSTLIRFQNVNFVEVLGCVLLQASGMSLPTPDAISEFLKKAKMDKTGYEAFQNHLHVDGIVTDESADSLQMLRSGLAIVNSWSQKLKSSYPNYTFHVVLSLDEENCAVRFYKLRHDEVPWIDVEDIEGFKLEGVLVQQV